MSDNIKSGQGSAPASSLPARPENAQNETVKVTSSQAALLLKAELANAARMIKEGKTLPAALRNKLESIMDGDRPAPQEYVDNVIELAEILAVTRRTISRWKKIEGNPGTRPDGRYHVPSWREFKRQRQGADEEEAEEIDATREKARRVLLQNEKLEVELSILKRDWVPAAEVEKWGGELGSAIRKVVSTIHLAAPTVVGVSVAEAENRLKEIEDEILQQLHLLSDSADQWKNSNESAH